MTAATITEKIIARAAGLDRVAPGDEVWATADRIIMNDSSGPRRLAGQVASLGGVRSRERVVLATDHFAPATEPGPERHRQIVALTRSWAEERGLPGFFDQQGILHNLVLERWLCRPGMLLVGADSHTTSAGALAAVAVAVGSTELATILATDELWLRVPESVRIELHGELPPHVDLRDLTIRILAEHEPQFASYCAVEFTGPAASTLSLEMRLVLTNQGIEMGAKNAIVAPSPALLAELAAAGLSVPDAPDSDPDATYRERLVYSLAELSPMVAAPPAPNHGIAVADAPRRAIDRVWLGSCVGGRLADLRAAASVLKGRSIRAPMTVTPATVNIHRAALADGTIAVLQAAGCIVHPPGCGACAGLHSGVARAGEVIVSTGTRNYPGRMGDRAAQIYLGSAFTAAASAIAGRIADPREVCA